MTFVSVGNAKHPFHRLLKGVAVIASKLPQPVVVQHGHTPFESPLCKAKAFMNMEEFILNIKNAELLIMHAGAGSVINTIEAGKVPVVMPRRISFREHVNDHQVEFAEALARACRVIMIESPEELESAVAKSLSVKEAAKLMDRGSGMVSLVRNKLAEIASKVDMGR